MIFILIINIYSNDKNMCLIMRGTIRLFFFKSSSIIIKYVLVKTVLRYLKVEVLCEYKDIIRIIVEDKYLRSYILHTLN